MCITSGGLINAQLLSSPPGEALLTPKLAVLLDFLGLPRPRRPIDRVHRLKEFVGPFQFRHTIGAMLLRARCAMSATARYLASSTGSNDTPCASRNAIAISFLIAKLTP
jgi:hypothetical protein